MKKIGIVQSIIENRSKVIKEEELKQNLSDLKKNFAIGTETLLKSCENARQNNSQQNMKSKISSSRDRLIEYSEKLESYLQRGISSSSSFKHTPIEPEKFGEQLGKTYFFKFFYFFIFFNFFFFQNFIFFLFF